MERPHFYSPKPMVMATMNSEKYDDSTQPYNSATGPPSLQYPIESKKKALVLTWSVIVFVNTILPVTIFYVLRHVLHYSTDFILNISQIPMTPTLLQFPYRLWQLKRRNGERSPRNRGRFTWDFFQWQFLFGVLLMTSVYAMAGVMDSYKLFALAPPILFSEPCRISSVPKGAQFRPAVYYIIEDLTAVDGGGGAQYRDRLAERWSSSPLFRYLVRDVGRILGCSGLLMVSVELTLILITPAEVYIGASWVILWTWAALSTCCCVSYAKTCLAVERDWWKLYASPTHGTS